MDEYGDIYFIDDARNASRDHRSQGMGSRPPFVRPTRAVVMQPATPTGAIRPTWTPPPSVMYPQGPAYAQAPVMYQQPVMYPQVMYPDQRTASSLLGRLTVPQLIEIAAQAFAALQSLPPAPTPTDVISTDVQNLVLYQTALAQHAKRDEQLRTLGALVAKLAG